MSESEVESSQVITAKEAEEYLRIAKNGYEKAMSDGNLGCAVGYRTEMMHWNDFLEDLI